MNGAYREHPQVKWDLLEIYNRIAKSDGAFTNADRVIDAYHQQCQRYARQPELGTPCFELKPDMRCFVFKRSFVAYYIPFDDRIMILRVLHGSRDIDFAFNFT